MLVYINKKVIDTDRIVAAEIERGPYGYGVKTYLETQVLHY